jgi:hypothetical protein
MDSVHTRESHVDVTSRVANVCVCASEHVCVVCRCVVCVRVRVSACAYHFCDSLAARTPSNSCEQTHLNSVSVGSIFRLRSTVALHDSRICPGPVAHTM